MAVHTQIGGVTIDAFQWLGGTLAAASLPYWALALALQTPGDGTLDVPTVRGTVRAGITDWALRMPTGTVHVLSATDFAALYV